MQTPLIHEEAPPTNRAFLITCVAGASLYTGALAIMLICYYVYAQK
jgi:hypothetical protein